MKIGKYPVVFNRNNSTIDVGCHRISFRDVLKVANELHRITSKDCDKPAQRRRTNNFKNTKMILEEWNEIPVLSYPIPSTKRII